MAVRDSFNSSQPSGSPDGDPALARAESVEALFREHNQSLVRFLAARLSSDAEAKEVAQEAYVRLLQLDQPRGAVSFLRAFLFKTAVNIATDRLRRRRLTSSSQIGDPFELTVDRRSPDTHAENAEEIQVIAACLDELGEQCRRAVLLSRLHGLSTSEVAAEMGVSTRMVRMYIAQSLLLMRRHIEAAHRPRRSGGFYGRIRQAMQRESAFRQADNRADKESGGE